MTSTANRSTGVWLVFAVLTLALAGPVIPETNAQSDETVTVQACRNAWNSASARLTCSSSPNDILLSGGQCRIKKTCQYYAYGPTGPNQLYLKSNDVTVPIDDVDNLHNCNGTLTVGSC